MNLPMNKAEASTSASVTQSLNAHRPKMDFWKKRAKATCACDRDDGVAASRSSSYQRWKTDGSELIDRLEREPLRDEVRLVVGLVRVVLVAR